MANAAQTIKQRGTKGNRQVFAAKRDGTDGYGDVGINDGSKIVCQTYWHVYTCQVVGGAIGATTLTTSALGINLHTAFPNNLMKEHLMVETCIVRLKTAFSGGDVSAMTISIGDTSNDDEWIDALNVFTGATAGYYHHFGEAGAVRALGGEEPYEAAYIPLLTLATTGGPSSDLTAGELEIWFKVTEIPDI